MAKPKPGGSPPPQARPQERHHRRGAHQELVQQHDRHDHRHRGQRHRLGVVRQRRLQGLAARARRSPPSWPPSRPPRRPMEHGLRQVEVQVKGPGSGRDTAVRSIQNTGIEVTVDQGRHPRAAQRLPPAQAAEGLSRHGSLHRPQGARLAPPRHQHLREREGPQGARAPSLPARRSTAAPVAATPAASTSPSCRRSRRPSTSTACSSGSSARPTRRPTACQGSPARTCCACSSSASTTSCTAPAGLAPARRPASSSTTA